MKYTAVFEFEEEPNIKKSDAWLGGKLCSVQFSDALEELDLLKLKMESIQSWIDSNSSVENLLC